jgi:hypothetical protein
MSRRAPLDERPRGSRIDDLGPTHIPVSPETRRFETEDRSVPPLGVRVRPLAESRRDAIERSHAWGLRPTGRF